MGKSNFERMIEIAEQSFDARNDPQQLDVNEEVLERLKKLHPATISEYDDGNGPAVWILLIPTTSHLMFEFLAKRIGEKQLLDLTPLQAKYEAIYLCSAMVLPEHRGKGLAKKLTIDAVNAICEEHPVEKLFVWPFSVEGKHLAESIASSCGKELLIRED